MRADDLLGDPADARDLELRVDLPAIRDLSRAMRADEETAEQPVTAVIVDDVLVAVEPGGPAQLPAGPGKKSATRRCPARCP